MARVYFVREKISMEVPLGVTVLEAEIRAGLEPDAPCGGQGSCGKCLVKVNGNPVLACQTKVVGDCQVEIPGKKKRGKILSEGFSRNVNFQPDLRVKRIRLEKPEIGEKRSEWERLLAAVYGDGEIHNDHEEIGCKNSAVPYIKVGAADVQLSGILYEKRMLAPVWEVIYTENEILDFRQSSNTEADLCQNQSGNDAGYIGADTSGCLLALRQDLKEETTLLLDIGTNTEMILGNKHGLAACSAASRPAFEGAKIQCGMRGLPGAIDHVKYENGKWQYTTIENEKPTGLCGSGLIDLIAELLRTGLLDENGILHSGQVKADNFVLVPSGESQREIYLTQKDIGEVQLAKAAIAAGIRLLMKKQNVEETQVQTVYLAGGFGNYMNARNAARIGLIPENFAEKVSCVGNAAGEGAKIALLNKKERHEAEKAVQKIEFLELAACPEFQDCFVDELGFGK